VNNAAVTNKNTSEQKRRSFWRTDNTANLAIRNRSLALEHFAALDRGKGLIHICRVAGHLAWQVKPTPFLNDSIVWPISRMINPCRTAATGWREAFGSSFFTVRREVLHPASRFFYLPPACKQLPKPARTSGVFIATEVQGARKSSYRYTEKATRLGDLWDLCGSTFVSNFGFPL